MNSQDTNQEDQKADDQLAIFLYLHQAYNSTKQKLYNARRTSMPGKQCPLLEKQCPCSNLPGFIKETDLPSFT
jgi:hypothetical protein